jgi:hypothetical protein
MLWIFVAPKNPSFLARFESANLESNGKHDNHYTNEPNYYSCYHIIAKIKTVKLRGLLFNIQPDAESHNYYDVQYANKCVNKIALELLQ